MFEKKKRVIAVLLNNITKVSFLIEFKREIQKKQLYIYLK